MDEFYRLNPAAKLVPVDLHPGGEVPFAQRFAWRQLQLIDAGLSVADAYTQVQAEVQRAEARRAARRAAGGQGAGAGGAAASSPAQQQQQQQPRPAGPDDDDWLAPSVAPVSNVIARVQAAEDEVIRRARQAGRLTS